MSAPIDPATISKIGGFTAFTDAAADYLNAVPDSCTGLGGPDLRVDDDENAADTDGDLIFPRLDGAWITTLVFEVVATSTGPTADDGYRAAVNAVIASLNTALDAMKAAPDDLTHAGGTEQAWFHSKVEPTWVDYHTCHVTFGLKIDAFA
jgi:hypothetical protein